MQAGPLVQTSSRPAKPSSMLLDCPGKFGTRGESCVCTCSWRPQTHRILPVIFAHACMPSWPTPHNSHVGGLLLSWSEPGGQESHRPIPLFAMHLTRDGLWVRGTRPLLSTRGQLGSSPIVSFPVRCAPDLDTPSRRGTAWHSTAEIVGQDLVSDIATS